MPNPSNPTKSSWNHSNIPSKFCFNPYQILKPQIQHPSQILPQTLQNPQSKTISQSPVQGFFEIHIPNPSKSIQIPPRFLPKPLTIFSGPTESPSRVPNPSRIRNLSNTSSTTFQYRIKVNDPECLQNQTNILPISFTKVLSKTIQCPSSRVLSTSFQNPSRIQGPSNTLPTFCQILPNILPISFTNMIPQTFQNP